MPKRKLSIWVEEDLAGRLEYMAQAEGLAVSQYGAVLLERAMREAADDLGWDVIGKRLEQTISKEVTRLGDRMGNLLVRGAVDSASSRGLIVEMLKILLNEEEAKRLDQGIGAYAVKRVRKPLDEIRELLGNETVDEATRGSR